MPDRALFIFTCCHCNAIVLATTQLRDAEAKRLANHLSTTHPNVPFYTPKLGLLLDHFVVRQSPLLRG